MRDQIFMGTFLACGVEKDISGENLAAAGATGMGSGRVEFVSLCDVRSVRAVRCKTK